MMAPLLKELHPEQFDPSKTVLKASGQAGTEKEVLRQTVTPYDLCPGQLSGWLLSNLVIKSLKAHGQ